MLLLACFINWHFRIARVSYGDLSVIHLTDKDIFWVDSYATFLGRTTFELFPCSDSDSNIWLWYSALLTHSI